MTNDRNGDEVGELRREVQQLRAELAAMRSVETTESDRGPVSRRALFGLAGAGVAGAVVAATASPAAAADGDNLVLGQQNTAATQTFLFGSFKTQTTGSTAIVGVETADGTGVRRRSAPHGL